MDLWERFVPQDMMRNAVILATFAYHTANAPELLERKPHNYVIRGSNGVTMGSK
jgi:hypothetical protein